MPRRAALFTLVATLALAAAPGAGAAWLAATDLMPAGQEGNAQQVAADGQGDAMAIWARYDGTHYVAETRFRPAGGAWQAAQGISPATGDAVNPHVAMDARGDAVAVWAHANIIEGSYRPAGGSWQAVASDLSAAGQNAAAPQVAIDGQGNAVAIWRRSDGTNQIVQTSTRSAATGAWQATPDDLSATGQDAADPEVAVDPQGDAVAVWSRGNAIMQTLFIQASTRPAGGAWQAPASTLSVGGEPADDPQVAVAANGKAVVVWQRSDPDFPSDPVIQASSGNATTGSWGPPATLSPQLKHAETPQVAIDAAGDATAVWALHNVDDVQATSLSGTTGIWEPHVDIAPASAVGYEPVVGMDARGDAIIIYNDQFDPINASGKSTVESAYRASTSTTWQPTGDLAARDTAVEFPQLAVTPRGDAVAVWRHYDGHTYIEQAAGFAGAPPTLSGLSIPATGVLGQPVALSVAPVDAWAPLGATSWDLGDGTSATGTAITHIFSAVGVHTVTVTSADTAGNTATASGTIDIVAAPGSATATNPTPAPAPGPHPAPPAGARRPAAPAVSVPKSAKASALKTGLTLRATVAAAGRISLSLSVSSKTLGLKGKAKQIVIASASATAKSAGTLKIELTAKKSYKKRLSRLKGKKLTLKISFAGTTTTKTLTLA